MKRTHRFYDLLAAWMGAFEIDWDADFETDGYTDPLGRAPLNEPFWLADLAEPERPSIQLVHAAGKSTARRA